MEFIKRSSLFDENNTLALTDDEIITIVTSLEMMINIYNHTIATKGEGVISIQEKEILNEMKELHG